MHKNSIFITGASSGLGKALAYELASRTNHLILSSRNEKELEKIRLDIEKTTKVTIIQADLLEEKEFSKLVEYIKTNPPDLLINCAGYTQYGRVLEKSFQEENAVFLVNLLRPIALTTETARALYREQKSGIIINVSSVAGYFVFSLYGEL